MHAFKNILDISDDNFSENFILKRIVLLFKMYFIV